MRLANFLNLRSIRMQLMVAYLLALLLASAVAALMFYILFIGRADDASSVKGMNFQALWIEEAIRFDAAGKPVGLDPNRNSPWIYDSISDDLEYAVLDTDGTMLFGSVPNGRVLIGPGQTFGQLPSLSKLTINGIAFATFTRPLQHAGATYYIQVARSDRLNSLVRRAIGMPMLKTAIWVVLACLLLLVGVVFLTLQLSLKPLREASEAAARIEPGNLSKRLEIGCLPTELTPLVEAFNKALDRLERGYRVQQEFLAGAAHELKTPLALIRAQIELDGAADRVSLLSDVDMMARQVHQLLHLAEVSESHNYAFEPICLAAVASEVTGYLGRLADMRQVSLTMTSAMTESRLVAADRSAAFVMLKNLVENAIRHSFVGGTVLVAIEETGLYVQDGGEGIAQDDFPKLYTRFWRGADRRDDGAGLGLAICHQIATNHGWTIDARNVSPGARFTVTFGAEPYNR